MKEEVLSQSTQEYLETLYILTRSGQEASVKDISERLHIAPASVTEMLKRLAEKGYVNHSPYQGATLTQEGRRIGAKMSRKHRLLERFLHDVLRIGKDTVHQQACDMEHALSDEAETALCRFLGHPDECPDDKKPIEPCDLRFPSCDECLKHQDKGLEQVGKRNANLISIADLREKDTGKVAFIRGGQKELRRLLDMGLTPNTPIKVVRAAPFGGPTEIEVRGSKLALGRKIAADVFVEMQKKEPVSKTNA